MINFPRLDEVDAFSSLPCPPSGFSLVFACPLVAIRFIVEHKLSFILQLHEPVLGLGSVVVGSLLALNVSLAEVTAWIIHLTGGFPYLA